MTGRLTCLLFLVVSILGKPATDYSGSEQLTGTENEQLKETLSINALNIKKLKANVTSLWAEINGIRKWTQQHEKGGHHNYESLGYHGHDYGYHAPDGHQPFYGSHYSHWHPGIYPPRVWYQYHIHDIVSGRSHHLPIHSKNHEYSSSKKMTDDSSEEEEEEEEEDEEKEKSDEKKKKKEKKPKEEEVEGEKKSEEEKKAEEEKKVEEEEEVEAEEVKENNLMEEVAEEEEVKKSDVMEKDKKLEEEKIVEHEEVGNGVVKKDVKDGEEENKAEEEEEEEEEEAKPRGRSLFGFKKVAKQGHSPQRDRKGHKNTIFHNIKGHIRSKNRPKNEAKKIDENEIISKAFCDFAPNIEIPESEVTGNVTIFQKRNSKGPLYFHVNLHINLSFVGMDEASRTHGFHIHANPISAIGHCNSTGPHFNPTGKTHGSLHSEIRHLGDFGNIVVDKRGKLDQYIFVDSTNTLMGENSIISRSIDVHENPDDLGKGGDEGSLRSGNAGRKLACCTIHSLADAWTKLNG